MELEIVLLLVELTAIILTALTCVQLHIKETAVMKMWLEWCAKVRVEIISSTNLLYL